MANLAALLVQKQQIEDRLNKLNFGTIQIQERGGKKYLHVYRRESGMVKSQYVGEYSIELYNVILENNKIAREYQKRLKEIYKQLKDLDDVGNVLSQDVELNMAVAKRNLVESIYKQSLLEGIATTFSDTETLVNEGVVHNLNGDEVTKILDMKHAWEFILDRDVLPYKTNYAILCPINYMVEESLSSLNGIIRSVPVTIGGSSYLPPLPYESQIKEELNSILENDVSIDTAIDLTLYIMKKQIFLGGNKRTAVIFANHYLVQNGLGLMIVPTEQVSEFKKLLILYYEDKEISSIKNFPKEKCWIKLR